MFQLSQFLKKNLKQKFLKFLFRLFSSNTKSVEFTLTTNSNFNKQKSETKDESGATEFDKELDALMMLCDDQD